MTPKPQDSKIIISWCDPEIVLLRFISQNFPDRCFFQDIRHFVKNADTTLKDMKLATRQLVLYQF